MVTSSTDVTLFVLFLGLSISLFLLGIPEWAFLLATLLNFWFILFFSPLGGELVSFGS